MLSLNYLVYVPATVKNLLQIFLYLKGKPLLNLIVYHESF
jgi:hypothetical protein